MTNTKESILLCSLRLFAADGYEAVSVSEIAGKIGITKGALYKHYKNKRDIFDSIIARMEQTDAERAISYTMPEGTLTEMPDKYLRTATDSLIDYSKAQFRYWTEDSFAAEFRKMLTVEQFRSIEMSSLYNRYLGSGPLNYVADLLKSSGIPHPAEAAAELYSPMFLLYTLYDSAEDKAAVTALADRCLENTRIKLKNLRKEDKK